MVKKTFLPKNFSISVRANEETSLIAFPPLPIKIAFFAFNFVTTVASKTLGEPEEDNLLWGIPYLLKDNFSTKDIPTTASSNILKNYVPFYDATVVEKLKNAGAINIGKTVLDELAIPATCNHSVNSIMF